MRVRPLFIEPGSPWENGYIVNFNVKLRAELLNREIFYSLREPQVLIEDWCQYYNTKGPHSALGQRLLVPEAIMVLSPHQVAHGLTYRVVHILGSDRDHRFINIIN